MLRKINTFFRNNLDEFVLTICYGALQGVDQMENETVLIPVSRREYITITIYGFMCLDQLLNGNAPVNTLEAAIWRADFFMKHFDEAMRGQS